MKGTVKFYNHTKGWGFITDKETGNDVFVHYSNIVATDNKGRKSLKQNEIVEYEMDEGRDGKSQAVNVIPVVTMRMIKKSLKEKGLRVKQVEDQYGMKQYFVMNIDDISQSPEYGMTFEELAGYAGYGATDRTKAVNVKIISNNKRYDDMTQDELTEEFINIIKQNYENGICLLDSNYELIKFNQILEKNIIKIDDAICIVRNLKKMPNFKRYCKGMTQ